MDNEAAHIVSRISEYTERVNKDRNVVFGFVDEAFEDIFKFWEQERIGGKSKHRRNVLEFTSKFIAALDIWRGDDLVELDLNKVLINIKIDDVFAKQLKRLREYYTEKERLYIVQIDYHIEICTYRKMESLYLIPRNLPSGPCVPIVKECTVYYPYYSAQPWLYVSYIPRKRPGLPRAPCIASLAYHIERREFLRCKLAQIADLGDLVKDEETTRHCVLCKQKRENDFAILDCCSHLICFQCNKLHSWKEW